MITLRLGHSSVKIDNLWKTPPQTHVSLASSQPGSKQDQRLDFLLI